MTDPEHLSEPEPLVEQAMNEASEDEQDEVQARIAELWDRYGKDVPF